MQAHQRARVAARHLHCNNGAPVSALNAVALVTHLLHQQMHLFADLAAMHAGRFRRVGEHESRQRRYDQIKALVAVNSRVQPPGAIDELHE